MPPEVTSEPFEVTETGWGEFDIVITVHFHPDISLPGSEKPVILYHRLKLHPLPDEKIKPDRSVTSWWYDDFIFTDPTEGIHSILQACPAPTLPPSGTWSIETEEKETNKLKDALDKVKEKKEAIKEEMAALQADLDRLRPDIHRLEKSLATGGSSGTG